MISSTFILFSLFFLKMSLVLSTDLLASLGILSAILCAIIVCVAIAAGLRRLFLLGRIAKENEHTPIIPEQILPKPTSSEESIPILSSPVSNPALIPFVSNTSPNDEIEEASEVKTSDSDRSLFEEYSKAHPLTDLDAFEAFGAKIEHVFKKAIQEGQDIRSFKQECEELLRFFYKHLARQYHPDKTLSCDAKAFKRLSNQLEKITEAWNQVEHKSEEEMRFYENLCKMDKKIKKEIQKLHASFEAYVKYQAQAQTQEQLKELQSELDELEQQRRRPFSEKLTETCCVIKA